MVLYIDSNLNSNYRYWIKHAANVRSSVTAIQFNEPILKLTESGSAAYDVKRALAVSAKSSSSTVAADDAFATKSELAVAVDEFRRLGPSAQ